METTTNPKNQHVGMLSSLGIGHIIPIISLAKRIIALQGFRVTIFIPANDSSPAQSQLIESQNLTQESYLQIIQLSPPPPPASGDDLLSCKLQTDAGIETRSTIAVKESLPVLRSVITDMVQRPTVLIVDIFGTDAFDLAVELGMLRFVFITTTAIFTAMMMYLPTLDKEAVGGRDNNNNNNNNNTDNGIKQHIQVPGCKPIHIQDIIHNPEQEDQENDGYKCLLHQASRYPMAHGILINTCEELEPMTIRALAENPILKHIGTPPVYPVGPITRVADPSILGYKYLDWLNKQPRRSVLYVSFGSGGTLSAEQMIELAWGLERSQQRFLWVVRAPTKKKGFGTYFNSGGGGGDPSDYLPKGFLRRTQGVGLVVPSWCPQIEILSHKAVGGCLTHCGWNTALESIVHGLPMIVWPLYAEQKVNASMLAEDIGVAIRPAISLSTGLVEQAEIEKMVRVVMVDEEGNTLRLRAKELKENALRAMDEGGSSHKSFLKVATQWKASPVH